MLKFELNVEERKTLAKRMEELTGIHPYYTKAPRYAYDIGNYTIDRDGNLLVEAENADLELLTTLMNEGLIRGGEDVDAETLQETADEQPAVDLAEGVQMIPAVHPNEQETCEGDSEEAEEDGESEMESAEQIPSEEGEEQPVAEEAIPLDADFSFPISQHNGVSLRNLVNLIYSRGELVSKATDGIFLADKGLVDALKDDSCTYAVANFIHALKEYEEQHGASLEGLTITVKAALEKLGYTCTYYAFSDSNDLSSVVTTAANDSDVIYAPTDNTVASNTEIINNICLPAKVPVIAGEEGICQACGVATLSISYYDLGYKTGEMAVSILQDGKDISKMPIEYAPKFTKEYNKDICDELGIKIPDGYEAIETDKTAE